MNQLLDSLFARAATVVAFVVGSFHLLNVSDLWVLSTRDIRVFHLMMMLVLLFLAKPSSKRFAESTVDRGRRGPGARALGRAGYHKILGFCPDETP